MVPSNFGREVTAAISRHPVPESAHRTLELTITRLVFIFVHGIQIFRTPPSHPPELIAARVSARLFINYFMYFHLIINVSLIVIIRDKIIIDLVYIIM